VVPVDPEGLVGAAAGQEDPSRLSLPLQVLDLLPGPGGVRPVERRRRPDDYRLLGAEDDAPLAAGAFVVVGDQPVGDRIVSVGTEGALPLAAAAGAAPLLVPYDLKLGKDE